MLRCKMGGYKVGVLEDTLMSEKEAREQAEGQPEANWASAVSAARTPPIGAKAQGILRGILHGSKNAIPNAWSQMRSPELRRSARHFPEL
jgi:hypothetical protein